MEMVECERANDGGKIRKENDEIYVPNWLMEVLAWITRMEMANSALSTASRTFNALCRPKMHSKVRPHFIHHLQIKHQINVHGNAVALAKCKIKYNEKFVSVPIPNVPMAKYILGFEKIDLSFINADIFVFMQQIAPSLGKIHLDMPNMPLPTESLIRRLLDMLAEQTTIHFNSDTHPFELFSATKTTFNEKANVIEMLEEARENDKGKQEQKQRQKLFHLTFENMFSRNTEKTDFIEAIKNEFANATQPFNFLMYVHFEYPELSVENEQTGETLAFHIRRDKQGESIWNFLIRHPTGQGEQWMATGKKRFWQSWGKPTTELTINNQICECLKPFVDRSKTAAKN